MLKFCFKSSIKESFEEDCGLISHLHNYYLVIKNMRSWNTGIFFWIVRNFFFPWTNVLGDWNINSFSQLVDSFYALFHFESQPPRMTDVFIPLCRWGESQNDSVTCLSKVSQLAKGRSGVNTQAWHQSPHILCDTSLKNKWLRRISIRWCEGAWGSILVFEKWAFQIL